LKKRRRNYWNWNWKEEKN
jgi:hypothetical protein